MGRKGESTGLKVYNLEGAASVLFSAGRINSSLFISHFITSGQSVLRSGCSGWTWSRPHVCLLFAQDMRILCVFISQSGRCCKM